MTRTEARRTQITCEFVQRVMADEDAGHSPFGLAGLWENWRDPNTGEWQRTFAIITAPSNELVGHNRMPAILEPESYDRWLALEPDPHDLLITYASEPMTMWPISIRVNKPENDEPSLEKPNYTGLDVIIVRDDKIAALYVFLDSMPS